VRCSLGRELPPDAVRLLARAAALGRARAVEARRHVEERRRRGGPPAAPEQARHEARHVAEVRIELAHPRRGAPRRHPGGLRALDGLGQAGAAQGQVRAQGLLVCARRGLEVDRREDVRVEVAVEAAAAELADDARVQRIEDEPSSGGIHERLDVLRQVDAAVEMEDLVQQHAARPGLRLEAHGEAAPQELGLAEALPAAPARRSPLGEGSEDPLRRSAGHLRPEGRVDGLEGGPRLAGREALEGRREEADAEQRVEGLGDREPGQAEAEPPGRVGADRLVGEGVHAHRAPRAPRGVEAPEQRPGGARRPGVEVGEPHDPLERPRGLGVPARHGEGRAGREPGGDVVGMLAGAAERFVEVRGWRARRIPREIRELGVGLRAPGVGLDHPRQLRARLGPPPQAPRHPREAEPRVERRRVARERGGEVLLRAREVAARQRRAAETDARRRRAGVCGEGACEAIPGGRELARLERALAELDQRGGEVGPRGRRRDARRRAAGDRDPRREDRREEAARDPRHRRRA
jgi:hypothetical protein